MLEMSPRDLAVAAVKLYQRGVSPMLPNTCRFYPSCSQYTVLAIQKHGVLRGVFMGAWRIMRCNPFSKGGFDPVR